MFSKPVSIAVVLTVIATIPLYLISARELQFSLQTLPLLILTLFVLLLIAAFWSARAAGRRTETLTGTTASSRRETGNVKWFNASKGFGFITRDSGDDVFVHFRSIRGKGHRVLRDGQRVEFEVTESEKGLQAEDVAVAG